MRALILATIVLATGCVRVHAHQREHMAKRAMTNDVDVGEGRFKGHASGSREGADGGTGHPSGGCGCN